MKKEMLEKVYNAQKNIIVSGDMATGKTTSVLFPLVDKMIEQGLIEEVKHLLNMGYSKDLVSMQGVGYKEIIPYINGECTIEEAVSELKQATRHLAKRQLTWFSRQCEGEWIRVDELKEEEIINKFLNSIEELLI